MISKRLQFTGSLSYKLSALFDLPEREESLAYAIFVHCFTCNKNYKIFSLANGPKSLITLNNADHLLSEKRDGKYVGKLIASWSSTYIDLTS